MKQLITTMAILSAMSVLDESVSAFPPSFGTSNRPTVSPYLNLLQNRNQSAALNYYRAYRPEIEFRNNEQRLGRSIRSLQTEFDRSQLTEPKSNSQLGTTGHPTTFGNTGTYFPSTFSGRR